MANNTRDVNLVIRARDEAKKTLVGVADALQQLIGVQAGFVQSGEKVDTLLGRLGTEFDRLNKELLGLTALGKVKKEMDEAAAQITRMENAVRRSKGSTSSLISEYGRTATATRQLKEAAEQATVAVTRQKTAIEETRAALASLRGQKGAAAESFKVFETAGLKEQQAALKTLRSESTATDLALRASARQEENLRNQAVTATKALREQRDALGDVRGQMASIVGAADGARKAIGGTALDQQALAAQSTKAAADLAKVTDALNKQRAAAGATGKQTGAAAATAQYRAQVQAVRDAETSWRQAQGEANKLAQTMRSVAQPTREMQTAFTLAASASKAARHEYIEQGVALNRLKGISASSYAEFDRRASAMSSAAASQSAAATAAAAGATANDRLNASQRRLAGTMDASGRSARNWADAVLRSANASRQALSFGQRLRAELLGMTTAYFGLYAAVQQVSSVITAFQAIEAVENRLGAVFDGDMGKVAGEVRWLRDEAIRLGISFQVLGDEYSKLSVATQAANFAQADTRKLFLSVAEAGRVNKLSIENMKGIFLALQQMISKGKINSEELTRQLGDRLPGAAHIFATALGMTTAELFKAMKAGEVFANRTTMLAAADALNERFGKQLPTSLQSLTTQLMRFEAIMFDIKMQVAEAGFAENLRLAINDLNTSLQSTEGKSWVQGISDALTGLVRAFTFVVKHFHELMAILRLFATYKLAQMFVSVAASVIKASGAVLTFSTQMRVAGAASRATFAGIIAQAGGARAAMLSMSAASALAAAGVRSIGVAVRGLLASLGPVGLAFVALSVAIELAFAAWGPGIDETSVALETHEAILQKVRKGYEDAKGDVDKWASSVKGVTQWEIQRQQIEELRREAAALEKISAPQDINWGPIPVFEDLREGIDDLRAVVKAFKDGKISGDEFRETVSEIGMASGQFSADYIQGLIDSSRQAEESRKRTEELAEAFKVVSGDAADASLSVLGLADALEAATDAAQAKNFEDYHEAIKGLKELVPELTKELEKLGEVASLKKFEEAILRMGPPTKEIAEYLRRAREEMADASIGKTFVDKVAGVESGGNARAKNPLSSATGLGQFIEDTWLRMFREHFPDRAEGMSRAAILALRNDANISRKMIELYAAENAAVLQKAGQATTDASLYLAHFLGPQGALKVLQAKGNTPVSQLLGADQISANASILQGKTAAEVVAWAERKMGLSERELAITQEIDKIEQDRTKRSDEYLKSLTEKNEQSKFEIENLKVEERQRHVNAQLRQEQLAAEKAGVEWTKQMSAERERLLGLEWDAANKDRLASEEKAQIEKQVNDLLEHRRLLMEQITFYEGQGNESQADVLREQLTATNDQLKLAIEQAVKFWEAVGGTEAQNKLLTLAQVKQNVEQAGQSFAWSAKSINDSLAGGMTSAFDKFSEAVANGANVVDSLRDAFLQFAADFLREIAQMIIKQALLNALGAATGGGGGAGGFLSGILGGLFHDGGVVGAGMKTRMANPAWFHKAMRYHTGGIAGLKPNEVPAILKKGEEVLTESDPRHIANGGAAGSSPANVKVINTFDAPSFLSESLNSAVGEQAILNFIQANQSRVKGAMGI